VLSARLRRALKRGNSAIATFMRKVAEPTRQRSMCARKSAGRSSAVSKPRNSGFGPRLATMRGAPNTRPSSSFRPLACTGTWPSVLRPDAPRPDVRERIDKLEEVIALVRCFFRRRRVESIWKARARCWF